MLQKQTQIVSQSSEGTRDNLEEPEARSERLLLLKQFENWNLRVSRELQSRAWQKRGSVNSKQYLKFLGVQIDRKSS